MNLRNVAGEFLRRPGVLVGLEQEIMLVGFVKWQVDCLPGECPDADESGRWIGF